MDDQTTTNASEGQVGVQNINGIPIDDQGMAIPEATVPSEPATAVDDTPAQPAEESDSTEADSEPDTAEPVDDTSEWLKKKGIDPTDPEAITKLAKSAREAEKAMHRNAQKASELERASKITDEQIDPTATPEQRDNIRIRNIELKSDIREWKYQNSDKLELEPQMVQILSDPNKRLMVQEGLLSLDDVYSMARGSSTDTASIKSQGGQEALRKLAQKLQAQTPRGNATNSAAMSGTSKITPQNVDQMVGSMSPEEYRRRLPEINRAMAG